MYKVDSGCINPFWVETKFKGEIPVPCGKCPDCKSRCVSQWSFRLMQEERQCDSAYFITLTYDNANVPINQKSLLMELCKRDVQLFIKRLRKSHEFVKRHGRMSQLDSIQRPQRINLSWYSGKPIKYFIVGEYGGRGSRPHYHIILFNAILELIQPAWNMGHVYYGTVTGASVGYTLKYMMKEPDNSNPEYLTREFRLMSKGLGESYIGEYVSMLGTKGRKKKQLVEYSANALWHYKDHFNRMYVNTYDGKKICMPRYYKQKLWNEHQRKGIGVHTRKAAVLRQHQKFSVQNKYSSYIDQHGNLYADEWYYTEKAENNIQRFKKMYADARKGRDLLYL